MGSINSETQVLVWAIAFLILMLITREIFCWYFKINQIASTLNQIRDHLTGQKSNDQVLEIIPRREQ